MPTLSIEISADAVPRIKAALRLRFPSGVDPETQVPFPDPTDQELLALLQQDVRDFIKRTVRDYESRAAEDQARASITDITIT